MSAPDVIHPHDPGFTPGTLEVEGERARHRKAIASFKASDLMVVGRAGDSSLFVIVRRAGKGGLCLRTTPNTGAVKITGQSPPALEPKARVRIREAGVQSTRQSAPQEDYV